MSDRADSPQKIAAEGGGGRGSIEFGRGVALSSVHASSGSAASGSERHPTPPVPPMTELVRECGEGEEQTPETAPVSVVIPTHDRPRLALEAVRSALGQTRPPQEVIVVDDGSHPPASGLLERELSELDHVRLLRNDEALGGSAARNRGWRAAGQPWVAFLDDDDTWLPEKLEVQLAFLETEGADYGWTAYRVVERETLELRDELHPGPGGLSRVLARSERSCCTLMVRRRVLEQVGGFDRSLPRNQDWDLFLRLARRGNGAYLDRVLTVVRHHIPDPDACIRGREMLVEKWSDEIAALPRDRRREVWAEHHWLLWTNHAQKGDLRGERRHILRALGIRPLRARYWKSLAITILHHLGWRGRHTSDGATSIRAETR